MFKHELRILIRNTRGDYLYPLTPCVNLTRGLFALKCNANRALDTVQSVAEVVEEVANKPVAPPTSFPRPTADEQKIRLTSTVRPLRGDCATRRSLYTARARPPLLRNSTRHYLIMFAIVVRLHIYVLVSSRNYHLRATM